MQVLYRDYDLNASGEELYDKKWNKLDGTYSQLNPDEDKDKKYCNLLTDLLKIIPIGIYSLYIYFTEIRFSGYNHDIELTNKLFEYQKIIYPLLIFYYIKSK